MKQTGEPGLGSREGGTKGLFVLPSWGQFCNLVVSSFLFTWIKVLLLTFRILDLGFEKDITVILNAVNAECQKRQNVLLSATLTEGKLRKNCGLMPVGAPLRGKDSLLCPACPAPRRSEVAAGGHTWVHGKLVGHRLVLVMVGQKQAPPCRRCSLLGTSFSVSTPLFHYESTFSSSF